MYRKLIIILAVILIGLLAERLIFTSADVKIEIEPPVLRASTNSELKIEVYRTNTLGFKTPFSNVELRFQIEEGSNLIEMTNETAAGSVKIRSKGLEGEAVIGIYSLKSGIQLKKVFVKILPRDVASK
ncbi:MAG: hypothetical protein K8I03_11565 [Ignavibacteria bacterium]|nr:hypothetical protein [Ignavibacteria bacterium]